MNTPVLSVRDLAVRIGRTTVVDGISFEVADGQTLGIVGESGSGKSMTVLAATGLIDVQGAVVTGSSRLTVGPSSGRSGVSGRPSAASPGGVELVGASDRVMRSVHGGDVGFVFQDPSTSLNPLLTLERQITESLQTHRRLSRGQARTRALELLEAVGIPEPESRLDGYPHQLSGGQRQRVMIAVALACDPKLLIADEPTTALDVTTQAQIIALVKELQHQRGTAVVWISHDLGVIGQVADEVTVLRHGVSVERAAITDIFDHPEHPYTRELLAARPLLGGEGPPEPRGESAFGSSGGAPVPGADAADRSGPGGPDSSVTAAGSLGPDGSARPGSPGATRVPGPTAADSSGSAAGWFPAVDGDAPLLSVENLDVRFTVGSPTGRRTVHAVKDVSFTIRPGTTLGLVGESGSGKSTVAGALTGLVKPHAGTASLAGTGVFDVPRRGVKALRRQISMVFQDPFASLNSRNPVGVAVAEPLQTHKLVAGRTERRRRVAELLELVGLPAAFAERYPHELSGGQRQRVSIARALAVRPRLLILDESTASLDVSVQAKVLDLLRDLQTELGLTYLFIAHDLAVVQRMSHDVLVMRAGEAVEYRPAVELFADPDDDYTRTLLAAVPPDHPTARG